MKSKFVVFVIVGTVLAAAIYSSSPSVAFGATTCVNNFGTGKDFICTEIKNGKAKAVFYCPDWKGQGGCIRVYSGGGSTGSDAGSGLPSEVTEAANALLAGSQNTTKVPKSGLDNGGLLKGQGDNQTTSKTIVGSQDRFCKEGTGGETGNKCIPCDPGLKFEVGCIDVLTGGPLDMGDRATSGSGKSDDTKSPKDLGGSNDDNDGNGPTINPGSQ